MITDNSVVEDIFSEISEKIENSQVQLEKPQENFPHCISVPKLCQHWVRRVLESIRCIMFQQADEVCIVDMPSIYLNSAPPVQWYREGKPEQSYEKNWTYGEDVNLTHFLFKFNQGTFTGWLNLIRTLSRCPVEIPVMMSDSVFLDSQEVKVPISAREELKVFLDSMNIKLHSAITIEEEFTRDAFIIKKLFEANEPVNAVDRMMTKTIQRMLNASGVIDGIFSAAVKTVCTRDITKRYDGFMDGMKVHSTPNGSCSVYSLNMMMNMETDDDFVKAVMTHQNTTHSPDDEPIIKSVLLETESSIGAVYASVVNEKCHIRISKFEIKKTGAWVNRFYMTLEQPFGYADIRLVEKRIRKWRKINS